MSNENKSNAHGNLRPLPLQFTRAQSQALSKLLPEHYTLELLSKLKKESSRSNPSKKIFTNEGNAVKKNGSTHAHVHAQPHAHIEPPVIPAPLISTPTESTTTPSSKRVLRDKKPASYLEDRFPEALPMPVPVNPKSGKMTPENIKKCADILRRLKKHKCAGPFLHPVDVEGLGLYDYYDVVSEPMDLSTVEKKLKGTEYLTIQEFGQDIKKIWDNALAYNTEGSSIHQMTLNMKTYFTKIFAEISDFQFNDKVKDLEEQVRYLTKAVTELTRPGVQTLAPPKPNKGGNKASRSPAVAHDEEMTVKEKKTLCEHIKKLQPEALQGVWEIVSKGLPEKQNDNEELVFDIDILPLKVARELERYVKSKISHGGHGGRAHPNGGAKSKANQHAHVQQPAPMISNPPVELAKRPKNEDAESKSSDSSFITDSESGSDDDRRHKTKPAANYHVKQQDLANFQAGGHGSMMNSFIVK